MYDNYILFAVAGLCVVIAFVSCLLREREYRKPRRSVIGENNYHKGKATRGIHYFV